MPAASGRCLHASGLGAAAWSGGLKKDAEPMWYSAEADRKSGQNLSGFKNKQVDDLIEKQRAILDVNERHAICREIDGVLSREVPFVLLWNINYTRLLYWNKFGTPPTVLGKYGDERAAYWYWWYDADSAAELKDAMADGLSLPKKPDTIRFDDIFKN